MQHVLQHSMEWSHWQADAARRLNVALFVATLLVAGILSVVRFPPMDLFFPLVELVVDVTSVDEPAAELAPPAETVVEPLPQPVVPVAEPAPAEQTAAETPLPLEPPVAESQSAPVPAPKLSVDWELEKTQAVMDAVDRMEMIVSVNPNFDQLRREAAIKFRASRAPAQKDISDYVEKDQAGRTIFRNGNI